MKTNSSPVAIFLAYAVFCVFWFFKTPVDLAHTFFDAVDRRLNKWMVRILGD